MQEKKLKGVDGIPNLQIPGEARKLTSRRTKLQKLNELMQASGGEFTDQILAVMRKLSMPKPAAVDTVRWENAKEELTTRDKRALTMIALGMKEKQVCEQLGMGGPTLRSLLKSENGKEELGRVYDRFVVEEAKKRIDEILPIAMDTAFRIMMNEDTKDNVRMEGAFRFMDRALGRPTQQIEMTHDLVRRIYQKMDEMKNAPSEVMTSEVKSDNSRAEDIEINPALAAQVVVIEEPKDAVDQWVKENL